MDILYDHNSSAAEQHEDKEAMAGNKDTLENKKLEPLLYRIQNDFPDTGAYCYFESDLYRNTVLQKRA